MGTAMYCLRPEASGNAAKAIFTLECVRETVKPSLLKVSTLKTSGDPPNSKDLNRQAPVTVTSGVRKKVGYRVLYNHVAARRRLTTRR